MLNLEQVKQLEAKIAKAINYVERVTKEKGSMLQQETELKTRLEAYQKRETELKAKLESYQNRIDELEVLVARFKEEQGQIEESILSALDRLNQFENDIEKSLKEKSDGDGATEAVSRAEDAVAERDAGVSEREDPAVPDDIIDPLGNAPDEAEGIDDSQEKGGELDIF